MERVVPEAGVEPARRLLRGIFVPLRLSTPELVCGLDFLFTSEIETFKTILEVFRRGGAVKSLHFHPDHCVGQA